MEYTVEDLSPVKRKISVQASSEEVDAALNDAVSLYRSSASIDGFRKGKAPVSVIKKRFHDRIYAEARQNLLTRLAGELLSQLEIQPVSGLDIESGPQEFTAGEPYPFSVEFEIFPNFDLPEYLGLSVDQEKVSVKESEVEAVLERLRSQLAKIETSVGPGPGIPGQIVNIDFEAYEDGKPVDDVHANDYDLLLNDGEWDELEELVGSIPVGEEKSGEVTFPDNFPIPSLAGRTLTMKVRVNSIKDRVVPKLDDSFAKELGHENLAKLMESARMGLEHGQERMNKRKAMKKLENYLLEKVEFDLPESMVNAQLRLLLTDLSARLERQGATLEDLGKSPDELNNEIRPEAESLARGQILLLAIARKEGLAVSEQDVLARIYRDSVMSGTDFNVMREQFQRSGMIHLLRDHMLADKAMDKIYESAVVTLVDSPHPDDTADQESDSE